MQYTTLGEYHLSESRVREIRLHGSAEGFQMLEYKLTFRGLL